MYDLLPDWSPDGSKIVFTRLWGGGYYILIMDADGLNQTLLTNSIVCGRRIYASDERIADEKDFFKSIENGYFEIKIE